MKAFSGHALHVLERRYLRRDAEGVVRETPEDLVRRVAQAVAEGEAAFDPAQVGPQARAFEEALAERAFLPNSPTLMNAGLPGGQLSACFVLPVSDAPGGLDATCAQAAAIQRTGAGTGFGLSGLCGLGEPEGPGAAGGPLAALERLDALTLAVSHGGRRRGANMGVLRVDHPDVRAFVRAKLEPGRLENFNLSVGLPDAFFAALDADAHLPLVARRDGAPVARVRAAELWDEIVRSAWASGDPGLLFLDAIEAANPVPARGPLEATNPCGEVPLHPFESCNLASIHLGRLVREGLHGPRLDFEELARLAGLVVRFLDDALEVNAWPFEALRRAARRTRKIGVGVMGLAEALLRLGLPYGDPRAVRLGEAVARTLAAAADEASARLGAARGNFEAHAQSRRAGEGPMRNATRLSIAPAGTISILAGTTSGIEPFFALSFRRQHVLGGERLEEIEPLVEQELGRRGAHGAALLAEVRRTGRLPPDAALDGLAPGVLATALELPAEAHLAMQAAFQRHVDNAVSKTVNLPAPATPADVAAAFRTAHRLGLKGVTVFRQDCRARQVLEAGLGAP